jgi:hypothetical protein
LSPARRIKPIAAGTRGSRTEAAFCGSPMCRSWSASDVPGSEPGSSEPSGEGYPPRVIGSRTRFRPK